MTPKNFTRRRFLGHTALGASAILGAGVLGAIPAHAQKRARPNFLFILVDDLRYDVFSFMNHPFIKTPNIDRLASEGAHLQNGFVTTSLCCPSRASFLTGTYAHTHGVMQNTLNDYDDQRTPSYASLLQRAGYYSGYFGKWHMGASGKVRPGFDRWMSFRGQGNYFDQAFTDEKGREIQSQGYITDILTGYAEEFIAARAGEARPWSLVVSHKAVHEPFSPAPRHENIYPDARTVEPAAASDDLSDEPEWMRAEQELMGRKRLSASEVAAYRVPQRIEPKPYDTHGAVEMKYLRAVQAVDESVGRILAALEKTGELDNTVIVFAGDNGFFLGEYGRGDKRLMQEPSLRVPMIVRYSHGVKAGTKIKEMALNIDMAPTILDYAGIKAPAVVQGRSWRPLLEKREVNWRKSFLYEYWIDLHPRVPNIVGVRTDDWKLITYPGVGQTLFPFFQGKDSLYHLGDDPNELRNLSGQASVAARERELRAELERLKRATGWRDGMPWNINPKGELLAHFDPKNARNGTLKRALLKPVADVSLGAVAPVKTEMGAALRFDGKNRLQVGPNSQLQLQNRNWTVEALVTPRSDGIILEHGGKGAGYVLFIRDGKPTFSVRAGQFVRLADAPDIVMDKRTHLVGEWDEHQVKLWVNGSLAASIDMGLPINRPVIEALVIGGTSETVVDEMAPTAGFTGLLHDLKIYSRALSATEIATRSRAQQAAKR